MHKYFMLCNCPKKYYKVKTCQALNYAAIGPQKTEQFDVYGRAGNWDNYEINQDAGALSWYGRAFKGNSGDNGSANVAD